MQGIRSVEHVLRVNHAGERGAICIYRGQIAISRWRAPDCVSALTDMLAHEHAHFRTFDLLLRQRGIRHCHALALWALGGWSLGLLTALLGTRAIWVCTAAIESTVNAHLEHQLAFIEADPEVLAAVQSIQADERAHEAHAARHGGKPSGAYAVLWYMVTGATSFAIWLSTRL